jgi:hypothetical protein
MTSGIRPDSICEITTIYGGYGNKALAHLHNGEIALNQTAINLYIKDFIRKYENGEEIKDNHEIKFNRWFDDITTDSRKYYFTYRDIKYGIATPIPRNPKIEFQKKVDWLLNDIETNIKNCKPPIPPPTRLVPEYDNVFTLGDLINWLFPQCEYCNKRYIRYLFKLHYDKVHLCKRCCWIYDIDSVDKYKTVDKIRSEVKKNINLSSYCNMQIEDNESITEKMKV